MPELDRFEARLTDAVHAFADRAATGVDASSVAARAVGQRRAGAFAWLWSPLPVPAGLLLTLVLLLGLLAWSVGVGAPWDQRTSVAPAPLPTASPSPAPTPTPTPSTDGEGDEYVTGTETLTLTTPYTTEGADGVTQYRGGVITIEAAMNDPRVRGTGTWQFSLDLYARAAPEWGPYHLQNDDGAWDGTCRGGTWNQGTTIIAACWLVGSGDYVGLTYYRQFVGQEGVFSLVEGLIYPDPPPASAP